MASTTVQLPKPFADIERTQLMYPHPTFIEPMHNFTRALAPSGSSSANGGPTVWIKHEDTNSPLAYGGNKIRKFEYVIAEALREGATHLVTVGGVQSNSQRQVVAVGNRVGLKVRMRLAITISLANTRYVRLFWYPILPSAILEMKIAPHTTVRVTCRSTRSSGQHGYLPRPETATTPKRTVD
jgi:1-aminocyclopropane-1-carboxylate deaminase